MAKKETKVQKTGFGYEKDGIKLDFTLTTPEAKKVFIELLDMAREDIIKSLE